jgi:hypothetical protein
LVYAIECSEYKGVIPFSWHAGTNNLFLCPEIASLSPTFLPPYIHTCCISYTQSLSYLKLITLEYFCFQITEPFEVQYYFSRLLINTLRCQREGGKICVHYFIIKFRFLHVQILYWMTFFYTLVCWYEYSYDNRNIENSYQ